MPLIDRPSRQPAWRRSIGAMPLLFLLFALMLALPCAPLAAAQPVTTLAPDAAERWVPFELTPHNHIRFTMTIGGRPAAALLDTGLSDSIVSPAFAAATGMQPTVGGQAIAIGGPVRIEWAASKPLTLGGMARTGGRFAIADLTALAPLGGEPIDVMVGSDLLSCCALDIDYDARRFRLLPSGRLPFRGVTAPLALTPGTGAYVTDIVLGGRRLRPMIVDTGDGSALTLSQQAFAASGYRPAALTSTIAYGLGGTIETPIAIVEGLRIGTLAPRGVELRIEAASGFSTLVGAAGRIGSGLLLRYRVLLDPRAGRMVFVPGAQAEMPVVRSTSGLLVSLSGERLTVLHVMANSPAAASGWRSGDAICRVDGAPARDSLSPRGMPGWTVDTPGRTVRLGLCDGTERMLTLRAFY